MKVKTAKFKLKTAAKEPKTKSVGTVMAENIRAELNNATDSERERLLNEGMARIYSACGNAKNHANSR